MRACGEITNWEWAILEPRLWFSRPPDGRRRPLRDAEADLIDWRLDCCHRFNPSRKSSSTRLWKQRGRSRWILRKSPNSILACSRSISLLAKPSAKQARRINVIFRVGRSEEHTSELQSRLHLVCRLLLDKKKDERTTRNDSDPCTHRQ